MQLKDIKLDEDAIATIIVEHSGRKTALSIARIICRKFPIKIDGYVKKVDTPPILTAPQQEGQVT